MGVGSYTTLTYLSNNGKDLSTTFAKWSIQVRNMDPGPALIASGFAWESIDTIDFDKVDPDSPMGLLIGDNSKLLKELQLTTEGLEMNAAHSKLQEKDDG